MLLTQVSLIGFAVLVSAQNPFYNVPVCARSCAISLPANCGGNPKCICQSQAWMWQVECCIAKSCSAADQVTSFQFANQLCSYVGVGLTQPSSCAATTKLASSTTAPVANPTKVAGYVSQGCYSEATNGSGNRALNVTDYIDPTGMTIESCVSYCSGKGQTYAGLEYSQECWCGSAIVNGASKLSDQSGCNLPCKGNSAEYCGGLAKLNVYEKV